jgi:hypothetical protein
VNEQMKKKETQKKKKLSALPELPIPKGAVTWLMISLAVAIGWHIQNAPIWAIAAAFVVGPFTYYRIIKEKPLPPKYLRLFLTFAGVAGIVVTFRTYLGRDPGITALILFSTLKLMEMKNRRDFMFIVFLCYFMVFGNFLYDQSIEDLGFTLAAAILITATLLRLNHPPKEKVKPSYLMRFSLKLTIYALPFTMMLFFLFPRTSGPLWNLSQESMLRFKSGFDDTIEPGQIAELAQSKLPAFKVEFPTGDVPRLRDLYFRGLVLWFTNGKKWQQGLLPSRYVRPRSYTGAGILHTITLEPHNQRWLFGLDWPAVIPGWSKILPGKVFQSRRAVKSHYRYRVLSRFDPAVLGTISDKEMGWALQLPRSNNLRLIQLGRTWREQSDTDEGVLQKAEQYFKTSGFVYTLNPGLMDTDEPIEDFLFNQRRGFCEHYASAFTMLMRAADIPARIILGYQGGEFNPVGKYLLVRQSEAHAWVEVWLEDSGWQRIDPTAWVAPERIEYGVDVSQAISNLGDLSEADRSLAVQDALKENILTKIYKFFKHHWDNINFQWDVWIISYDRYRQRDFFRELGFEDVGRAGLLAAMVLIVPLFFVTVSFLLKRQTLSTDPLLKLYKRFCLKLKKAGLQRLHWEGPVHFQERAMEKFPDKAETIRQVTGLFVHLHYGRLEVTKSRLKQLKRHIGKV